MILGKSLPPHHPCDNKLKLTNNPSVNCRLPQTPRTPTTAAAHYFDDIWSKTKKGGPRPLRRSSTHRNLGFSGVSSNGDYANGDHDEALSDFDLRRASSVGWLSEEDLRKKAEVDSRVASFVNDQLQRMRSNDSAGADAMEDEIETSFDGV
jgi:hypothetical protein